MANSEYRGCILILALVSVVYFAFRWQPNGEPASGSGLSSATMHDGSTLELVQVVFRHGARTPLSTMYWPDTKWESCSEYPGIALQVKDVFGGPSPPPMLDQDALPLPGGCKMGELTKNGYTMAQKLGDWLRQRYVANTSLLSESYQPAELYMRVTSFGRTINTLRGVLAGMFPEAAESAAEATAFAAPELHEDLYGKNTTCPRLGPIQAFLWNASTAKLAGDAEVAAARARVVAALGKAAEPVNFIRLRDSLAAMLADGQAAPAGLTPQIMDLITAQATWHEAAVVAPAASHGLLSPPAAREALRLTIGPLVWHLLHRMRSHVACSEGRMKHRRACRRERMILHSAHDNTIMPLAQALGHPVSMWPPFTDSIVLELLRSAKGEYSVRLLMGQQPVLFNGAELLSLDDFHLLVSPYLISGAEHSHTCVVIEGPAAENEQAPANATTDSITHKAGSNASAPVTAGDANFTAPGLPSNSSSGGAGAAGADGATPAAGTVAGTPAGGGGEVAAASNVSESGSSGAVGAVKEGSAGVGAAAAVGEGQAATAGKAPEGAAGGQAAAAGRGAGRRKSVRRSFE